MEANNYSSGKHVEKSHSGSPEVHAEGIGMTNYYFRCHVHWCAAVPFRHKFQLPRSAKRRCRGGYICAKERPIWLTSAFLKRRHPMEVFNKTEVPKYDMPLARNKDICGFDIAVDDPAAVEEFDSNYLVMKYCE